MARNDAEKQGQLNQEEQDVLTCSIAMWLETKGFSKVLKRFLSAAQIQDDSWKAKALNLNEIFSQYLETCQKVNEDSGVKKQEEKLAGAIEANENCLASEEVEKKKKKKKNTKGHNAVIDTAETLETTIKSNEKAQEDKNGKGSDGLGGDDKKSKAPKGPDDGIHVNSNLDQSAKKKKGKLKSNSDEKQVDAEPKVPELRQKGSLAEAAETGVNDSKKASKKRKKKDAEENGNRFSQEPALEESKPKKTKHQEECKDALPAEENALASEPVSNDEGTNVALNTNEVDKSGSISAKKQHKNSAEPKSVNAFQRVKIDEVEFADERLQDNSYWAKAGAEIGYGAKAQEVLGQVKGRDFRHEKTKKKRGSYRGGQIDLQSHSVKFNYSDEE